MTREAVLIVDQNWTIVFASTTTTKLFGRPQSAFLGSSIFCLLPERIRDGQKKLWASAPELRVDALGIRNSEEFNLKVEIAPIPETALCCVIMRDLTGTQQNRQTQKMEALGLLAGGVAHDFNNALMAIVGFTESVKSDLPEGSEFIEDLDEVLRAAENAGKLTQQLLSFSRRRPLESAVVELNRAVRDVEKLLRQTLPVSIALSVVLSDNDIHVRFALGELDQVLINLAANARDAMPQGGTLLISLTQQRVVDSADLPEDDYAVLSVTDTGAGIAPEVASRIFDPFFTTKGDNGTGLGLSTCFGIARQVGGTLTATSALREGTTFTLYIPIAPTVPLRSLATTQDVKLRPHSGVALVVEDQASIRKLVARTVAQAGLETHVASCAEQAISIMRSLGKPLNLLICDMTLSGMGGIELAAMLREQNPSLKTLLTSGYAVRGEDLNTLSGRDAIFLPKPFTPKQLRRQIELLMSPPQKVTGRILLVEPDAKEEAEARELLSNIGHDFVVMQSGEQALQHIQATTNSPSLVFLSIDLRDVSAHTILEAVRSRPLTATLPIIILETETTKCTFDYGRHTSLLSRPLTCEKLTAALFRVGLELS